MVDKDPKGILIIKRIDAPGVPEYQMAMAIRVKTRSRKAFAQRLVERREELGYSQSDLARALGVSSTGVWNWEHGNSVPRASNLLALAKLLRVSPEYLRDGDDAPSQVVLEPGPAERGELDITHLIRDARERIARAVGVPVSAVRVVIDFAEQ